MSESERLWTIEVFRGVNAVAKFQAPLHRLETKSASELLKILVAKFEELSFEEFVATFLNKRKGGPQGISIEDAKYFADPEKALAGYWVHGPTVSACARYGLSTDACEFIRENINKNRAAG